MAAVGGEGDESNEGSAGRQRPAAYRQQTLTLVTADHRTTRVAVIRVPRPTVVDSTGGRVCSYNTNAVRTAATAEQQNKPFDSKCKQEA